MSLPASAVKQYHEQGYYHPIRVLSPEEAAGYRRRLEAFEASQGGSLKGEMKHKAHLLLTWLDDLVRHPKILDAVEDLIGPNILCWSSSFFLKEARDPSYISWHQDLTYWGLEPADIVTAWVAFSPSTRESGCMRVVPGTHTREILPHTDTFAENNLLSRGQEVAVEVDEDEAVDIELQPGEMSLHHVKLVHGSEPNRSSDRRLGFAIRYIPAYVRQVAGARDSALLVRGEDPNRYFEHEPRPERDMDPAALALHREIMQRQQQVLYRGTDKAAFR